MRINSRLAFTATVFACASLSLGACATKRYPIATNIGMSERSMMTCHDLDLELVRAEEVRLQISQTAKTDWRSVAGFLGDYGIGNAMAKNDAEKAINARVVAINDAKAEKKCGPQASLGDTVMRVLGGFF